MWRPVLKRTLLQLCTHTQKIPQHTHTHTHTNDYVCDNVLTSQSFPSLRPGHQGIWLVNSAVLTSGLSPPGQQQDRSIAANCEIDGLQAVCVAELIEFPHQTPVVWTGACHNMCTHTHTHSHTPSPPPSPVSVFELTAALLLLFISQQQMRHQSTCSLFFLSIFIFSWLRFSRCLTSC